MTEETKVEGEVQETPSANPRNRVMEEIAKSTQARDAEELQAFDEETGQVEAKAQPEEVKTDPEPVEAAPVVAAPPAPKMVSITVDGQQLEVEESRILEAGKRTLQKESAADKRLQEATREKQEAQALLASYRQLTGQQPNTAPSQDAPAQQATEGVVIDPEALDQLFDRKLYHRDAQKARATFDQEFPEIANDPYLMQVAAAREQERLNTVAALGESVGDPVVAYRKHGESIREWLKSKATALAQPAVVSDKLAQKRTITAVSAANARAPVQQEKKPLTTSEQIEQMRLQRKQGRLPQQTQH